MNRLPIDNGSADWRTPTDGSSISGGRHRPVMSRQSEAHHHQHDG